jgi:dephospho-CoA kinase
MFRHGAKPVIGLIGAIGAGKSTVARSFAARGGRVVDADALGHEALRQGEIVAKVVDRWGERVRKPDGSLDRRAIGRIVFADSSERIALEELVFPYIGKRCREEVALGLADPTAHFVVLDAAVMLEAGWNNETDWIVYVDAPRPTRLARLAHRSGWTDRELALRESAQWSEHVKKSRADAIIVNDSDVAALQKQVDALLKEWEVLPERPGAAFVSTG